MRGNRNRGALIGGLRPRRRASGERISATLSGRNRASYWKASQVTLEGMVISWSAVARTPISRNPLTNVGPGALEVYDLPDLAATIAPRPLTIRDPVDAAGKPGSTGSRVGIGRSTHLQS